MHTREPKDREVSKSKCSNLVLAPTKMHKEPVHKSKVTGATFKQGAMCRMCDCKSECSSHSWQWELCTQTLQKLFVCASMRPHAQLQQLIRTVCISGWESGVVHHCQSEYKISITFMVRALVWGALSERRYFLIYSIYGMK